MTTDAALLLTETGRYLGQQQRDILGRWVQRVSRLPLYLQRPQTRLQEVMDRMPQVLQELCTTLPQPASGEADEPPERAAKHHARDRYAQDVPAAVIIKEYQLLRDEIWVAIEGWPRPLALTGDEVFVLQRRINWLLDDFIATTLATFISLEDSHNDPRSDRTTDDPGGG
jgi:hypothetical protein